jgi:hypothetical protein
MTQVSPRIILVGGVSRGAHESALRQIPQKELRSSSCQTVLPVDDVERQLTECLVATSGSAPTTGATSFAERTRGAVLPRQSWFGIWRNGCSPHGEVVEDVPSTALARGFGNCPRVVGARTV